MPPPMIRPDLPPCPLLVQQVAEVACLASQEAINLLEEA